MAAIRQVVALLDRHLELKAPRARYFCDRLRAVQLLPNTPGVAETASNEHIATLLVAIMIGPSRTLPAAEYLGLLSADGTVFGDALASYFGKPEDLLELRLDTGSPAAVIIARAPDGNVSETLYLPAIVEPRSKIGRIAALDANAFSALALAIRNATPQPAAAVAGVGEIMPEPTKEPSDAAIASAFAMWSAVAGLHLMPPLTAPKRPKC
jgi:hypothetical protein